MPRLNHATIHQLSCSAAALIVSHPNIAISTSGLEFSGGGGNVTDLLIEIIEGVFRAYSPGAQKAMEENAKREAPE